jgi:hypothetical protein
MAPARISRSRVGAPIALFLAVLAVLVATPWSSALAAEDNEEPKAGRSEPDFTPQAEDTDKPKDKSLLARKPADEAVAKKAEEDQAFYEKWQFWAITGGIVAGGLLAYFAGSALYHAMNGGDVRPCNMMTFNAGCFGQGEPR